MAKIKNIRNILKSNVTFRFYRTSIIWRFKSRLLVTLTHMIIFPEFQKNQKTRAKPLDVIVLIFT